MRNFIRKTARRVSDAQPSNWASLCLKNDIFSFCSNHGPEIPSATPSVKSTSAFNCRALCRRCDGELLAGPDHQLRANFPGARAARSACPPRSGARRKKLGLVGHRENQIRHGGRHLKVFYGENLFCRQSRETCESGLSDHADHEVIITDYLSLSEGLPPEPTSPSARRGRRPPVAGGCDRRRRRMRRLSVCLGRQCGRPRHYGK